MQKEVFRTIQFTNFDDIELYIAIGYCLEI